MTHINHYDIKKSNESNAAFDKLPKLSVGMSREDLGVWYYTSTAEQGQK